MTSPAPLPAAAGAPLAADADALVERLAADLVRRWQLGERPLAEEYLDRHPQLWAQPEAATELIFEEICLRREAGQELPAENFLRRFPQWREQLAVLLDCHHALQRSEQTAAYPTAGEVLGEFRLLAELGRGVHGRVFLATQAALADRPVVLKFTARGSGEHLALSRLQHTHIVPLYSVQDDAARNLRALCMPYFGGQTLAQLASRLQDIPLDQRVGAQLLESLRQAQAAAPVALPADGPACQLLRHASYVKAICWIGACLADALHYAHERGLVHLDLKPSNVLLAADGQPMLLDLHLARAPIPAGMPAPAWLGGTPGYMAPEHRAAVAAVNEGGMVQAAVDGRADIFGLGVVLYELLAGQMPPTAQPPGPALRKRNPLVSAGLADVLAKCLAPEPARRYQSAAPFGDDLRRHLVDLPLRGVPNRSWTERWQKWRKRRPYVPALVSLLLAVGAAAAVLMILVGRQLDKGREALREGQAFFERGRYGPARAAWKKGLALVEDIPFEQGLTSQLREHMRRAEQALAARDLHRFAERVRALAGGDSLPAAASTVEAHCRTFWDRRHLITERLGSFPDPHLREQIETDLLDLAILGTDLRVRLAPRGQTAATRREALEVLGEAEALFGPSCVTCAARRAHAGALGMTDTAAIAARQGLAVAPRTAWEHFGLGRVLFQAGDLPAAAAEFDAALAETPQAFWPTFYKGKCAYGRRQYEDAVLAFTACIVLAPDRAWCWHDRGLAYAALGQLRRARADYERALHLDPGLGSTWLARGLLEYREGRYQHALADLQQALNHGAAPAAIHFARAFVYLAQGQQATAFQCACQALTPAGGAVSAPR
jgi:serine/threonine protein kinase